MRAKVFAITDRVHAITPVSRSSDDGCKLVPVPLHPRLRPRALVPNPVVVVCPPLYVSPSTEPIIIIAITAITVIILIIVVPSPLCVLSDVLRVTDAVARPYGGPPSHLCARGSLSGSSSGEALAPPKYRRGVSRAPKITGLLIGDISAWRPLRV